MSRLTEKQSDAWADAIKRLRGYYDSLPADIRSWEVTYSEEIRLGRGHFINATYVDGEVFAQILVDVYGYPNVSLAYLDWIHADSDEECGCDPCIAEREDGAA